MAKTINVNETQAVVANSKKPVTKSLKGQLQDMQNQFAKALPSVMTPERFVRIGTTALTRNPKLANCTAPSFFGAMLSAAQLGLEPNTSLGQAYLIPYENKKLGVTECQFQIGYRGLIELAHRSGDLQSIEAHCVYENDYFEYELGLEPKLVHKPAMSNRGKLTWVYAVMKLKSGGYGFEVMSKEDLDIHRDQYAKYSDIWRKNWEEMAKKTVVKKVLKYAPMASEFVKASAEDGSVLNFKDDGDEYEIVPEYPDAIESEFEEVEIAEN